jgi:hypothetical protein
VAAGRDSRARQDFLQSFGGHGEGTSTAARGSEFWCRKKTYFHTSTRDAAAGVPPRSGPGATETVLGSAGTCAASKNPGATK